MEPRRFEARTGERGSASSTHPPQRGYCFGVELFGVAFEAACFLWWCFLCFLTDFDVAAGCCCELLGAACTAGGLVSAWFEFVDGACDANASEPAINVRPNAVVS